jgi:CHAT domain-containing protein
VPDVEQVQATLPRGACLLEYGLLGDELICFAIRRDSFEVLRGFGTRREIQDTVQWFWFHIRKGGFGADFLRANQRRLAPALDRALDRLSQLVLSPLTHALERADHVVLVPHGQLHTLPFHALRFRGVPLIERIAVTYAPSAGVFLNALRRDGGPPERPLVLAPDLPGLPWVDDEAVRIGQLFPDAIVLRGRRATLGALRRNARRCDALHLATHGVFRADNPAFSALELADGWLSVGELAELSGDRALVTLSACHTAMSGIGPGDELVGLTRAVLGAGSAALLASLWAVDDDTTANLMTTFYTGLRRGQSRAASLRAAALEVRASDPHPYFWAPFVLVGAP